VRGSATSVVVEGAVKLEQAAKSAIELAAMPARIHLTTGSCRKERGCAVVIKNCARTR
jgi:hypothetical protein